LRSVSKTERIFFMRKLFPDYFIITLKGLAMGAADVVPGVSGGTIAFISGIYQELIDTINKVDLSFFSSWKKNGFKIAWQQINGSFLVALLMGIAISVLTFSKIITHLLATEPIMVWSYFFGLVVASIFFIGKQITKFSFGTIAFFLIGTVVSYYITIAEPAASPDSYFYLFLSGFIAIIAMILPGISGAFILLLMGSYAVVIGTINQFREGLVSLNPTIIFNAMLKLGTFAIGAILGLKLFSKILHWMFDNHRNNTLALLTGFMLGSLNKVWPWKKVISTRIDSHGAEVPFLEKSIMPFHFEGDNQLIIAIVLMIVGFLTIFIVEKVGTKYSK
jgi:putative membrane protein